MQRHDAGLGAGSDQREDERQRAERRRRMRGAHLRESVEAVRAGQEAEGEQQRERAEARHHQIDVAGAHVFRDARVRHHQRPGGERHELPGEQERVSVIGEYDQRHAGEEGGVERQHALRRGFVLAIAEREQAGAHGAEIDHDEEEGGQRVEPEMRAEPRHAERQRETEQAPPRRGDAPARR